jgi:uncharacterized protein
VLVVVRGADADPGATSLAELLGPERYASMQRLLLRRAVEWANSVAPGRVTVGYEPEEAGASLRTLVGDGVDLLALVGDDESRRLETAVDWVFDQGDGPVLIAWPDLPGWRSVHGLAALADLRDGCDVSVGPVYDGGFYLLALARPLPALFTLPADTWRSTEALGRALAVVHEAGLDAGMVRAERGLHRPADVRAALADPLLDPELAAVLREP